MKGLFVKDLMILKSRKQLFLVVGLLAIMYAFMGMQAFAMQFLGLLGASSVVSTLSYDLMDNGGAFLFALPFTKKQYIAEKYLISFAGGFIGLLLGLLVVAVGFLTGNPIPSEDLIPYLAAGICIIVGMVAMMIPLEIKFGAESSRTAMFAVVAAVLIAVVVISKIIPKSVAARVLVFAMGLSDLQIVLGGILPALRDLLFNRGVILRMAGIPSVHHADVALGLLRLLLRHARAPSRTSVNVQNSPISASFPSKLALVPISLT